MENKNVSHWQYDVRDIFKLIRFQRENNFQFKWRFLIHVSQL